MYIIITSKPGEYTAKAENGLTTIKTFDYCFYGKRKAEFHIVKVDSETARVRIVEEGDKGLTNSIPYKFFESFEAIEDAKKELACLARFGDMEVSLKERR